MKNKANYSMTELQEAANALVEAVEAITSLLGGCAISTGYLDGEAHRIHLLSDALDGSDYDILCSLGATVIDDHPYRRADLNVGGVDFIAYEGFLAEYNRRMEAKA